MTHRFHNAHAHAVLWEEHTADSTRDATLASLTESVADLAECVHEIVAAMATDAISHATELARRPLRPCGAAQGVAICASHTLQIRVTQCSIG